MKWMLVISRAKNLEAVAKLGVMGFRAHVPSAEIEKDDQFVCYLTMMAFGNLSTGVSRVVGVGTFTDLPTWRPVKILDLEYPVRVPIRIDGLIQPLREGVPFKPFIPDMDFIVKKHVWASYVRKTIAPISDRDFEKLSKSVLQRASQNS